LMLHAMAVECLLKALWLRHGEVLVHDGKFVPIPNAGNHKLAAQAGVVFAKAGIQLTDHELKMLERASLWIMAGRYPIQRGPEYLLPVQHPDGVYPNNLWDGDDVRGLDAFIARLLDLVGCELRYEPSARERAAADQGGATADTSRDPAE